MRYLMILAVLLICADVQAATSIVMDAAEVDKQSIPFDGFVAVRLILDNRAGAADLTDVRFKMDIHLGSLVGLGGWSWDTPDNPWYGARPEISALEPFAEYNQGIAFYPVTQDWAPYMMLFYRPGHALYVPPPPWLEEWEIPIWNADYNQVEIRDQVPVGFVWDHPVKLIGVTELFSTAEGHLTSGELNQTLYDDDRSPQTIPEPSVLILLAAGLPLLWRRYYSAKRRFAAKHE